MTFNIQKVTAQVKYYRPQQKVETEKKSTNDVKEKMIYSKTSCQLKTLVEIDFFHLHFSLFPFHLTNFGTFFQNFLPRTKLVSGA